MAARSTRKEKPQAEKAEEPPAGKATQGKKKIARMAVAKGACTVDLIKPAKGAVRPNDASPGRKSNSRQHTMRHCVFNMHENCNALGVVIHGDRKLSNSSWLSRVIDNMVRSPETSEDLFSPIVFCNGTFFLVDEEGELMKNDREHNVRMHIAQVDLPKQQEDVVKVIEQIHSCVTQAVSTHLDASGHTFLPLREEDIVHGKRFSEVMGEQGATFCLRRKFSPEKAINWASEHEEEMDAFCEKGSIKEQTTMCATKCTDEWLKDE